MKNIHLTQGALGGLSTSWSGLRALPWRSEIPFAVATLLVLALAWFA